MDPASYGTCMLSRIWLYQVPTSVVVVVCSCCCYLHSSITVHGTLQNTREQATGQWLFNIKFNMGEIEKGKGSRGRAKQGSNIH